MTHRLEAVEGCPVVGNQTGIEYALEHGNLSSQVQAITAKMEVIYKVNILAELCKRLRIESRFRAFQKCPTALHIHVFVFGDLHPE